MIISSGSWWVQEELKWPKGYLSIYLRKFLKARGFRSTAQLGVIRYLFIVISLI
jgi:hypothetical protein